MEVIELYEQNEKSKYFSLATKIWVMILTITILFIVYKSINDRDIYIEKLEDKNIQLSQKIYEYKKNTVIQNKDILTNYLTKYFKEMREYRVISLINGGGEHTIVRVIIDEPIKTTENNLGYEKSNWIDLITIIEPTKLEIKDFFPIIINKEIKSEPVVNKNAWFYKIQEFFSNQFSELLIFFSESSIKINKIITDMNIDSIENPILFVNIDDKQSVQNLENPFLENLNLKKSECADLQKNTNETDENFSERATKCISISAIEGLYNVLKSFEKYYIDNKELE